jgi:hypothetical protein
MSFSSFALVRTFGTLFLIIAYLLVMGGNISFQSPNLAGVSQLVPGFPAASTYATYYAFALDDTRSFGIAATISQSEPFQIRPGCISVNIH